MGSEAGKPIEVALETGKVLVVVLKNGDPSWIEWGSIIFPGLMVSLVAVQVWLIRKNLDQQRIATEKKTALDLFDRRVEVFTALESGLRTGFDATGSETIRVGGSLLHPFRSRAWFLFGDDILPLYESCREFMMEKLKLLSARETFAANTSLLPKEKERRFEIEKELAGWDKRSDAQFEKLRTGFAPYLKFADVIPNPPPPESPS